MVSDYIESNVKSNARAWYFVNGYSFAYHIFLVTMFPYNWYSISMPHCLPCAVMVKLNTSLPIDDDYAGFQCSDEIVIYIFEVCSMKGHPEDVV